MTTHDIKLPPLPVGTTSPMVHGAYYCASDMHDYALAAIKAYQQRLQDPHAVTLAMCHRTIAPITFDMLAYVLGDAERYAWVIDQRRYIMGEPVAWLYEDELPDNYPYEAMFPYSKVDGVRMFPVYAPQPAAPEPDHIRDAQLAAIKADLQRTAELLKNPAHVHTNMCRGIIAPVTFDQLAHVLGDEATQEWLADRQQRGEPVAITNERGGLDWIPGKRRYTEVGDILYTVPQPATPAQEPSVPDGWQLVPKEPTAYMMFMGVACWNLHDDSRDDVLEIYRGMLEAAPKFGEEE